VYLFDPRKGNAKAGGGRNNRLRDEVERVGDSDEGYFGEEVTPGIANDNAPYRAVNVLRLSTESKDNKVVNVTQH
jgi:hypothetical protein